MINVFDYNIFVGFFGFLTSFVCIYTLMNKKLVGIYDPLSYHILWIASHLGLMIMLIEANGVDTLAIFFC